MTAKRKQFEFETNPEQ